jgi:hypothetical protein
MNLVSFKHLSPYDGCFWEWQYMGEDKGVLYPISFAYGWRDRPQSAPVTLEELNTYDISNLTIEEWNEWMEISLNDVSAFWAFAQEHELPFLWNCEHCGPTHNAPGETGGYRGNGGVGIEVLSLYCDECTCSLTCSYCGYLNDPDDPWWWTDEDIAKYEAGLCPACGHGR